MTIEKIVADIELCKDLVDPKEWVNTVFVSVDYENHFSRKSSLNSSPENGPSDLFLNPGVLVN